MKRILTIIITACLCQAASAQNPPATLTGKVLYIASCTPCHGEDGTRGKYGAKNLHESRLTDEKLFTKVSNGGWIMPAWKKTLSAAQIQSLVVYIKNLRN